MSFYRKYELKRLLKDGEPKTFAAIAVESRKPVLLHLFQAVAADVARSPLVAAAKGLSGSNGVIEVGEFAGAAYVITEEVAPFEGLDALLAGKGAAPAPIEPAAPPPSPKITRLHEPPPAPRDAGEFSQVFAPTAKQAPPQNGPGEFTRFFGSGMRSEPMDIDAQDPTPQPESRPFQQASEFTRMFGPQAGSEGKLTAPPFVALANNQTAEVSSFFAVPKPAMDAPPPVLESADGVTVSDPGEFTRIVRGRAEPPKEEPPPAARVLSKAPWALWKQMLIVCGSIFVVAALVIVLVIFFRS